MCSTLRHPNAIAQSVRLLTAVLLTLVMSSCGARTTLRTTAEDHVGIEIGELWV